ncbi:MAG: large repetitive protein [Actinomycetota bacterium]|nr:large repetitive protein [Actinomycetota bacterium]
MRQSPDHGTAVVNPDGSFTYTPATNFNGTDSFTYKIDGGPLKKEPITATVTITVNAVNDAPVAVDDAYVTNEDTPLSVPVLGNDSDVEGSALTVAVVTGPSIGSVVLNPDQSFTYTPAANANGSDSFTYRASDGAAQSNVATVNITVVPVNDAPVAVNDASTTDEDTTVDIDVAVNDTDVHNANADLRAVSVSSATGGTATLQPDGRTVRFVPAANANSLNRPGGFSFTYQARDGALTSANTATVSITVNPVNDAPLLAPVPSQSGRWGNVLTVDADAIDVDVPADTLTYSLATAPAGAAIDAATGVVTWTPTAAQVGTANFVVQVDDGGTPNLSAQTSFTMTVTRRPSLLVYTGGTTGQFSDPATVKATLTDDGGGALQGQPVSGKTVVFNIGSQTTAGTTDGSGLAQASITLNQPAASPGVVALFAGDGAYLADTEVDPFTITPENATVAWTGQSLVVAIGSPVNLSGTVAEAADGSLGNRLDATQLRFTVRRNSNGTVAGTCTAPVNPTGSGTGAGACRLNLGIGFYTVTVELVGNGYYAAPPVTSPTIIVIAV